jgi:hypothetical protein
VIKLSRQGYTVLLIDLQREGKERKGREEGKGREGNCYWVYSTHFKLNLFQVEFLGFAQVSTFVINGITIFPISD